MSVNSTADAAPPDVVVSLSARRAQRSLAPLEHLDATPSADLREHPAYRTMAPLPAAWDDGASKAAHGEAGEPMIARLNRHMAARRANEVAPFGVARRPRRGLAVAAVGVVAASAIAAATLLHREPNSVSTSVDANVAASMRSDMSRLPLTELRQVTPADTAVSRAASAISALTAPPDQIVARAPSVATAEAAAHTGEEVAPVPQSAAAVTVAAPAPQAIEPANASEQPAVAAEAGEMAEVAPVRGPDASSVEDGYRLFKAGDVDAARAVFLRGASRGEADAAFAMGVTYDPKSLAEAKIIAVTPDPKKAVYWYRRAHRMAQGARQRSSSGR